MAATAEGDPETGTEDEPVARGDLTYDHSLSDPVVKDPLGAFDKEE